MAEHAESKSETSWSYQPSFTAKAVVKLFKFVNKFVEWHKLPSILGTFNLLAFRYKLRANNLHDGYASKAAQGTASTDPLTDKRILTTRSSDGRWNSLEMPRMGSASVRFGRNIPREAGREPMDEELVTPNPRLQTRDKFEIPLLGGDERPSKTGKMSVPKSVPDKVLDSIENKCPGYINTKTPWWDGSQLYGTSEEMTSMIRKDVPDGKLALDSEKMKVFLPRDPKTGLPVTGFKKIGGSAWRSCTRSSRWNILPVFEMFREKHPDWTRDQIFDKARLVVDCLMAKLHTVEWTPAILAHPALERGMKANWWGLAGEFLTKKVGRLSSSEIISGIPGSGADQDGVPYSLTEEFVSVYRMHTLIPDNIALFNAQTGRHEQTTPIQDVAFQKARDL